MGRIFSHNPVREVCRRNFTSEGFGLLRGAPALCDVRQCTAGRLCSSADGPLFLGFSCCLHDSNDVALASDCFNFCITYSMPEIKLKHV